MQAQTWPIFPWSLLAVRHHGVHLLMQRSLQRGKFGAMDVGLEDLTEATLTMVKHIWSNGAVLQENQSHME